jgi:hypothetical protein
LRGVGDRSGPGRGQIRPRGVHSHPLLMTHVKFTPIRCGEPKRKGKPTYRWSVGKHDERPEVIIAVPPGLEADGAPRPRGRVFPREVVVQQLQMRQRRRVGRLAHVVDAELPLHEGMIRLWWRLVRTEATPNSASARLFNMIRSDSS